MLVMTCLLERWLKVRRHMNHIATLAGCYWCDSTGEGWWLNPFIQHFHFGILPITRIDFQSRVSRHMFEILGLLLALLTIRSYNVLRQEDQGKP